MGSGYAQLRRALLTIAGFSDRAWRQQTTTPLPGPHVYWDRELLEKQLPEDDHTIEIPVPSMSRRLFLLPPTSVSVRGFLSVNWHFGPGGKDSHQQGAASSTGVARPVTRTFRVFLLPSHSATPVTPTVIRFDEKEEGPAWSFAHAQLCDLMTPYTELFAPRDPVCWISPTLPRIPLAATQRPEPILVCLLAGLYGIDSPLLTKVLNALHDKDSRSVARRLGWGG